MTEKMNSRLRWNDKEDCGNDRKKTLYAMTF
jgi:hypothetical protein